MTQKKIKIIAILIIVLIVGIPISGIFTVHNSHIYFILDNKVKPYKAGTYENYTIVNNGIYNEDTSGYLNITSESKDISINMHLNYNNSCNSSKHMAEITTNRIIDRTGDRFSYNNSRIILPFFYNSNSQTLMQDGKQIENYSKKNITHSMISTGGIYMYHMGIYLYSSFNKNSSRGASCVGIAYDAHSHLLHSMYDLGDPILANITGAFYNNSSYPMGMNLFLDKTNIIVFPVDWLYVGLVYFVVGLSIGFFVIVPAVIILSISAYRKHRKKGHKNGK